MRYPNVTWRIILSVYLFTTELRHTCTFRIFFLSRPNTYLLQLTYLMDVALRKPKSALRILLVSTFRVSSINYYRLWSLPIYTRSSANADGPRAHCQLKFVKCCTNVRRVAFEKTCNLRMTFKVIEGHCHCCHLIGHIRFPICLPL